MTVSATYIRKFVQESNSIEGICRDPTAAELRTTAEFFRLKRVSLSAVIGFVWQCDTNPDAGLRDRPGMNVVISTGRVVHHRPPQGGPMVRQAFEHILESINRDDASPYKMHCLYETLHPFMDGNGRSGRVLWGWQMIRHKHRPGIELAFLHSFYYQALEAARAA